jgi:hypothetical protein
MKATLKQLLFCAASASSRGRLWKYTLFLALIFCRLLFIPNGFSQTAPQWAGNQLPAGCIAWWQAESNELDTVGGHNGVAEDGPNFYAPGYAAGKHGQAWSFNGVNQSVMIPNTYADLDGWTQFTMEAWVNVTNFTAAVGNAYSVFSKVGNNRGPFSGNYGYQFGFTLNASSLFCQFNQDGQLWPGYQTVANLQGAVATNEWVHIAATYDSSAVKLYLNGVPLVTNIIGPATIASTVASLRISMDDNFNVPFPGLIDDARIYNRSLSATEIAYLYSGPPPSLTIQTASAATNIVSWPAPAYGWLLEQTPSLISSGAAWSQVSPPYHTNATEVWVPLANAPDRMFYRLRWNGVMP